MIRRTTLTAATCGVAAAALLLTACGGSKTDDAKITTSPPTTTATPTTPTPTPPATTPPADPKAPVFDFPKDVTFDIQTPKTGDPVKDTILRDHGYAIKAIQLAYVKQNPDLPVFEAYTTGQGRVSWATNIKEYRAKDETVTGHMQYYDFKVTVTNATTAGVSYCEDQTQSFDKDAKTGKVNRDAPDPSDYVGWSDLMKKSTSGTWQVAGSTMKRGVSECAR
ncbi:hypothetical protein [Streptomyces sp. CA-111067]|uniref:hypothetical protein n=1 Tax=Streptomyces sp. CA-111067 TaxID=3240046 RepID=UPI003D96F228